MNIVRPVSPTCLLLLTVAIGAVGGCNASSDEKINVAGEVTYDEQPLQEGEIRFRVAGHAMEASKITDGRYSLRLPQGPAEIKIFAYRERTSPGGQVAVTGVAPVMENYIPLKYNDKSELNAEIAEPVEDLNFQLTP